MSRRASIIIPAHNAALTVASTLHSILDQLTPQDEVIVVDDGSSDDTARLVEAFHRDGVELIRLPGSGGPSRPRNAGIERSAGRYVFLFDSDDIMLPGKLDASVATLESHPDAGMVFTNFRQVDTNGTVLKARFLDEYEIMQDLDPDDPRPTRFESPDCCRFLARENYIGTSGVALRREVIETLGGFDESLPNGSDRDLWFRITRRYPIVYLPTPYHDYRLISTGISQRSAHQTVPWRTMVLLRQLADPVDEQFAQDIRRQIGGNYETLAYESFRGGQMRRARAEMREAWRYRPSQGLVRMFLLSLLGVHGVRFLKALRGRLSKSTNPRTEQLDTTFYLD